MTDLNVATARASCRAASEDRLLIHELPTGLLVVVADGAGGISGGAQAAELFLDHARSCVPSPTFDSSSEQAWVDLMIEADRQIAADPTAGETTGIALLLTSAGVTGASAGDSEAWLVTNDDFDALTIDQKRKRFGSGRAAPVAFTRSLAMGNLIVATDGLFAYATPEAICEAGRQADLQGAAQRLVTLARLPSGSFSDDVAVVVVAARRTKLP